MMKKKLNFIGMLMLLLTVTATLYGQNNMVEPRRTAEEQAAFEKTIPVNPAKIPVTTQVDPRMETADVQVSPTNWKPAVQSEEERIVPEPSKAARQIVTPETNHPQPLGTQPSGKTLNSRDMNGPKTQPDALKTGSVADYRNQNGVKTQPEGEKPKVK
jgi:hypothetical protein